MIEEIKHMMVKQGIDAWVVYDFGDSNPAFTALLGSHFLTRKVFVVLGRSEDTIICHSIDRGVLENDGIPSNYSIISYNTWSELIDVLKETLRGMDRIAMDISEDGLLPRSSFADYGTVCLIKKIVEDVVPSSDLFQVLVARMSNESYRLHAEACMDVERIKNDAFRLIFSTIYDKGSIKEYEVQQFILGEFEKLGMVTDSNPIVAIGKNASNPHYEPKEQACDAICKGDLVLIDLWAKYKQDDAVFADITWMGYVGDNVPEEFDNLFRIVKRASDEAIQFIRDNIGKRPICGYEVDDVCRSVIVGCGYGEYFTHRTGHSLSVGER